MGESSVGRVKAWRMEKSVLAGTHFRISKTLGTAGVSMHTRWVLCGNQ